MDWVEIFNKPATISALICSLWSIGFYLWQKSIDNKYQKQIENLKAKNDKLNYITKTQFDEEFSIYKDLAEKSFNAVVSLQIVFFHINNSEHTYNSVKERYNIARDNLNSFQLQIHKYYPFMKKEIFSEYDILAKEISERFASIKDKNENFETIETTVTEEEIWALYTDVNEQIKKYLQTIKVGN